MGWNLIFSLDNLTNRDYYETQNFFESRLHRRAPVIASNPCHPGLPADCRGGSYIPVARKMTGGRCTFLMAT